MFSLLSPLTSAWDRLFSDRQTAIKYLASRWHCCILALFCNQRIFQSERSERTCVKNTSKALKGWVIVLHHYLSKLKMRLFSSWTNGLRAEVFSKALCSLTKAWRLLPLDLREFGDGEGPVALGEDHRQLLTDHLILLITHTHTQIWNKVSCFIYLFFYFNSLVCLFPGRFYCWHFML